MWIAPEAKRLQRWVVPGLAVAVGVSVAVTLATKGSARTGLVALAVLLGYAAHLAYRRGEAVLPVQQASDTGGRRARNHLKAAAMTGDVLIGVIVAALLVQALRGAEVGTLALLAGLGGVSYLTSIVIMNRTSR